jgi:flagellar motor switch protein FliN
MSDIAQEQSSSLVQRFAEAASSVLSQISGTQLMAQPVAADAPTPAATLVRVELSGALEGACEIVLSAHMTAEFAALLMGETPDPAAEINNDTREAAAELVQQICGNAADRLRRDFGPLELRPHLTTEADTETGARQLLLIARENDALEIELRILRLAAAEPPKPITQSPSQPAIQPPPSTPLPAVPSAPQAALQSAALQSMDKATAAAPVNSQLSSRNLDLLLDIELGVTLRFGTRQMLLKDIIELCSGSVVELDRPMRDPVDLLIDGRLIAHGEVVIVEGNYGLRITQVATQSEKLACLP